MTQKSQPDSKSLSYFNREKQKSSGHYIISTNSLVIIDDGPKVAIVDESNIVHIVLIEFGHDY